MKNLSRYLAIFFSIGFVALVFYYFSDIVAYLIIAWVLSMMGQPFMRFFQNRIKIGRFQAGTGFSAVLTILCFFIIFAAVISMLIPPVVEQARGVDYSMLASGLEVPIAQLNHWLIDIGLMEREQSIELELQENLKNWIEPAKIGNLFTSLIGAAGNLVFALFSIVFITFFFLKERGLFASGLAAIIPNEHEGHLRNALDSITRLLGRYFTGILIQITIITIFISVALGILGVKNALLIGFFAAIINVIPYLGPLIGAIFAILITISSNLDLAFYAEMMPLLLKVVAVFGAMQMLDNFVLQPYIFSNSVLAHPLEIFIVI
ncbi:MAG: AI-2E family transporter, partial [Bacteroidota bacterium]